MRGVECRNIDIEHFVFSLKFKDIAYKWDEKKRERMSRKVKMCSVLWERGVS